ncbi:MAG: hypothetical protein R3307_00675 [Anaerolineales bacterium]|nr:hypothetical protein [Anaerolineales bacterium]
MNGYLFLMMITLSPRVWGYSDYSQEIKAKVPPQTTSERRQALLVALPWFIFAFGFPIYSTAVLKGKLMDEMPVYIAFLNLFAMFIMGTIGDLVILDWLIVSKITPEFVIIPGTTKEDYRDFSHHYKAQVKATLIIIPILLVIALIISYV